MDETEETETKVRIRDKRPQDLTVGDNLKINAAALAIMAGVGAAVVVVPAAVESGVEKYRNWKFERNFKKFKKGNELDED